MMKIMHKNQSSPQSGEAPAKGVYVYAYRGFESLPLRQISHEISPLAKISDLFHLAPRDEQRRNVTGTDAQRDWSRAGFGSCAVPRNSLMEAA